MSTSRSISLPKDVPVQHPAIAGIVDKAKAMLPVSRVWLYGSRGRGDHHPKSDIDMAFEMSTDDAQAWVYFLSDVHENARTLLNVDLVDVDACGAELRASIFREGVLLYDKQNP